MKFNELGIQEFLKFGTDGGLLGFAGEHAVIMNADAMGDLRAQLEEKVGQVAARAMLTQFGFAQGWRMANGLHEEFEWPSDEVWRSAGSHLGALAGILRSKAVISETLGPRGLRLEESYEAQQQISRHGVADQPACWTVTGFLSGYLSRTEGIDILVSEDECVAQGDEACRLVGRSRTTWEAERSQNESPYSKLAIELLLSQVNKTPGKIAKKNASPSASPPIQAVESAAGIVTHNAVMREAVNLAERVAGVNLTVLISGESGTGKERIARFIHAHSSRADRPFFAINCGAINENLLESELFGHARGSFTGAVQSRAGIFEAANHGTLLLDEIGEISLAMQVKLLRVLQEHEVQRVGESETRPIDVRLLASTNCDLHLQTELGTFRDDLYYRIHVVEVLVPPLRHRREDILPLARNLLQQSAARLKRQVVGFSPAVADQLLRHTWPGNVRELENAMERAVALAPGSRIELTDLPPRILLLPEVHTEKLDSVRPLQDISKDYILAALDLNQGNQTHTARQLGIGTATLYRKLKSYGYRVEDQDTALDPVSAIIEPS